MGPWYLSAAQGAQRAREALSRMFKDYIIVAHGPCTPSTRCARYGHVVGCKMKRSGQNLLKLSEDARLTHGGALGQ